MDKKYGEQYYIKGNKVYYSNFKGYGINTGSILKSIEVIDSKIRLNHHDDHKKQIPDAVYDKMKEMLINHYHGIALKINEFINQLPRDVMVRINGNIIETIYNIDNDYIEYDWYFIYPDGVGSGYYWSLRLKKEDPRIGRRKLYKSSKGMYFIENGYRNYIDSFYTIK